MRWQSPDKNDRKRRKNSSCIRQTINRSSATLSTGLNVSWSRYADGITLNAVVNTAITDVLGLTAPGFIAAIAQQIEQLEREIPETKPVALLSPITEVEPEKKTKRFKRTRKWFVRHV